MTTGLTIDYNRNKCYHADACRSQILEFDYDPKTGNICNGRVVFDFKNTNFNPLPLILGLNVDTDGILWATLYESSTLVRINPRTSSLVNVIEFPSKGLSGIVFAGPNLDQIYITASRDLVNAYGGGIAERRPNDVTFFKLEGINARGFDTPRAVL